MDLVIAFVLFFLLLVVSVLKGIFLAYPLAGGIILFALIAMRRGYGLRELLQMAYQGGKKSFIVVEVLILIGALIPIWIASGTLPAIVYSGIELIKPDLFVLIAFLISCLVSFLIGSAFGTTGVVGTALMVIARSGDVNLSAAAGAIIAGAYFGDRCSPVSSSASFVAYITQTDIYDNIRNMLRTSIVPFFLAVAFYFVVSQRFPLHGKSIGINRLIGDAFQLNWLVLAPVVVIVLFSIFKANIRISMAASILAATLVSVAIQHQTISYCLHFMVFGFEMDATSPLYGVIKSGGMISLLKTAVIVFLASSFAGVMEGTRLLNPIERMTSKAKSRGAVFQNVLVTSVVGSAFGCSQTFAVMLTYMLNKRAYETNKLDDSTVAMDLENTAIMISPLIPWNIALLAPMTFLGAGASCIPYLAYIYLVPLCNFIYLKGKRQDG